MNRNQKTYDVFIGNLTRETNDKDLGKLFCKIGEIAAIIIRDDLKSPGIKIAFIKFLCESDAERAVKEMSGFIYNGKKLNVRRSEPRKKGDGDAGAGGDFNKGIQQNLSRPRGSDSSLNSMDDTGGSIFLGAGDILCTHVENVTSLWGQVINEENKDKLILLMQQLQELCPAAPRAAKVERNKIYGCLYAEDGLWYRCIVRTLSDRAAKIHYIDYGNMEDVSPDQLVELPMNISGQRPFAQKYTMHKAQAKDNEDFLGIQFLSGIASAKVLLAEPTRPFKDGSGYFAKLYMVNEDKTRRDLADILKEHGLLVLKDKIDKTESQHESNVPSLMSQTAQGGSNYGVGNTHNRNGNQLGFGQQSSGFGQQSGGFGQQSGFGSQSGFASSAVSPHQNTQPSFQRRNNDFSNLQNSVNKSPVDKKERSEFEEARRKDAHEKQKFKQEVKNLKQSYEMVKNEKDVCSLELNSSKTKIKSLQNENEVLNKKIADNTLSRKINFVVGLANRVLKLRRKFPNFNTEQFPTGQQSSLEKAINLLHGNKRIHSSLISSLPSVFSAVSTYKAAQKEVQECTAPSELEEIILARDESRRSLYQHVAVCVTELNSIPTVQRLKDLQEMDNELEKEYSCYLTIIVSSCPRLCDLESAFAEWMQRKKTEFDEVRTVTDQNKLAAVTALSKLQHALNLNVADEDEDTGDIDDIDRCIQRYSQALQTEINVTDMEHNKESGFVSTMLTAAKQEISSEKNSIDSVMKMTEEFREMKQDIEPWLNNNPDVERIAEIRKPLRSLKSKLRHFQADKEDILEASDAMDGEEMKKILSDISDIQKHIHEILKEEDEILNLLADLSVEQFPELNLQHPEMNLCTVLKYNGLLKVNRDIDYFTMEPMPNTGLFMSKFAGENVFIHECLTGDDEKTKHDFIERATSFNHNCPHLQRIQALFPSKSGRQMYIQTPFFNYRPLDEIVKERSFNAREKQHILLCVLKSLSVLHRNKEIYGELDPHHIMVCEDDLQTIVREPDFTLTPFERLKKRSYPETNGLTFHSPQIDRCKNALYSMDLYSYGAVSLWLHHPKTLFDKRVDGTPDLSGAFMDNKVQQMIEGLLHGTSEDRVTTDDWLKCEYLTTTLREKKRKSGESHLQNLLDNIAAQKKQDAEESDSEKSRGTSPYPEVTDISNVPLPDGTGDEFDDPQPCDSSTTLVCDDYKKDCSPGGDADMNGCSDSDHSDVSTGKMEKMNYSHNCSKEEIEFEKGDSSEDSCPDDID